MTRGTPQVTKHLFQHRPDRTWSIHEPNGEFPNNYELHASFAAGEPLADGLPNRMELNGGRDKNIVMSRAVAERLYEALGEALQWDGRTQLERDVERKDDVIAELRKQNEVLLRRAERAEAGGQE